jgi:hypothetical protein
MQIDAAELEARRAPKTRLIGVRHLDGRTRAAARARKLAADFEAQIGGTITTAMRIAIERAATLVVVAEDSRARRLSGDSTVLLDDLVRIDRLAAQAVRNLGINVEKKPQRQTLADYLRAKHDAG